MYLFKYSARIIQSRRMGLDYPLLCGEYNRLRMASSVKSLCVEECGCFFRYFNALYTYSPMHDIAPRFCYTCCHGQWAQAGNFKSLIVEYFRYAVERFIEEMSISTMRSELCI